MNYTCPNCLEDFSLKHKPKPTKSGNHYCSNECKLTHLNKIRVRTSNLKGKCLNCQNIISSKQRYCNSCFESGKFTKKFTGPSQEYLSKIRSEVCSDCLMNIQPNKHKRCHSCYLAHIKDTNANTTLKEYQIGLKKPHTKLRSLSQKKALKIFPNPTCCICGYSTYVEVCHIKGISEFLDESLVSEINALGNLTFLCPNHHKEFDFKLTAIKPTPISELKAAYSPLETASK